MKRFIALARVSSREQEREGFSLDVQEEAFKEYAERHNATLVETFRIAETATRSQERKVFNEVIAFAKRHHQTLNGILFYKVDRAARNLKDFVLLEELESDFGIEFISITQPTQNTPTGRMMRRQLATIASFTTEQQSVDVREGIAKRVQSGLPPSRAPFGYRNVRRNRRSVVEIHPENGPKVQKIFRLFAYHGLSVETLVERLCEEGIFYSPSRPKFSLSKIYGLLHDRHYIGEVKYHGDWHPGVHKRLIDSQTWDRAQVLLGKKVYRSHQMLYAGELITCGFCGRPISGETKERRTKAGLGQYTYYRCARYNVGEHPRVRVKASVLDAQVLALFDEMHRRCEPVRPWLIAVYLERIKETHGASEGKITELKRQLSRVVSQQDELLELRIGGRIDDQRFDAKQSELEGRQAHLKQQIQAVMSDHSKDAGRSAEAAQVFRLIMEKWPSADFTTKRRILEIVFDGFTLVGETLVPLNRTPFELLVAG